METLDLADVLHELEEVADEGRFPDDVLIDVDLDMLTGLRPSQLAEWLVERFEIRHRDPNAASRQVDPPVV